MSPAGGAIVGMIVVDGHAIRLRRHAVERYVMRVKPALDLDSAIDDIRRVALHAEFGDAPTWAGGASFGGRHLGSEFRHWLYMGADIAWPLRRSGDRGFLAITCITRGAISDRAREGRSHHRRGRRHFNDRTTQGEERRQLLRRRRPPTIGEAWE